MSQPAGFLDGDGPRWFTVPAGRAFLNDLAEGLSGLGGRLPEAQVLTPTRRGARALAQAFSAKIGDGAMLLPQIRAIGDLDEGEPPFDLDHLALDLPPAVASLRRRLELTRMVQAHVPGCSLRRALELADALGGFFDSLALEEIDAAERLDSLVTGDGGDGYVLESWAEHWQISARFLSLATREWPRRLKALGMMDPNQRQIALIRRLVAQWSQTPPSAPLILAGSTGSAPAMADLMKVVAHAPKGAVVLPGLDLSLADDAWALIDDSHPQSTLKRLLDRHGVPRESVRLWPASVTADRRAHARRRLLNEALRPAEATSDWLAQIEGLKAENPQAFPEGLDGLTRLEAANDEDAAAIIGLLMREALETPGRTCALITPDIDLSRRVAARLSRWGIQADTSAGAPLLHALPGRFLNTLLRLLAAPHDPVRLLELFRNPLCRFSGEIDAQKTLERTLRGARPVSAAALALSLSGHEGARAMLIACLDGWESLQGPMSLSDAARALARWGESLAHDGGQALWSGAAGAEASRLLADLIREGEDVSLSGPSEFEAALTHLFSQAKVRTGANTHPRLRILGALEARLVGADRVILAGLEEGVWPQTPSQDPFLSRPLRQRLGLPPPERRTGLSAHDFVQAAACPEAWLITRRRADSKPQVPSRWLWRLETLAKGGRAELPARPELSDWARAIDAPLAERPPELAPAARPTPRPPVELRPRSLSVTAVETLIRDPYAIYARRVLHLKPLDRLNEPVEARERGTAIHRALDRFVKEDFPLGDAGQARLAACLEEELRATRLAPAGVALWRPLLPAMAGAYVTFEAERREGRPAIFSEIEGHVTFAAPLGGFTLTARADRIERHETGAVLLDFKTGTPPSRKEVLKGYAPQLTLTAAIVRLGGFDGLPANIPIADLGYVRIAPGADRWSSLIDPKGSSGDEMAEAAFTALKARIARYDDQSTPYLSWAAPKYDKYGGDYDHLARRYEWDVLGDDGEGSASSEASGESAGAQGES